MHRSIKIYASVAAITATLVFLIAAFWMTAFYRYGDNGNNYGMMVAWQTIIAKGTYLPSRFQGNLPTEIISGYLAAAFGPIGPNSFSLVMSLAALALLVVIFRQVETDLVTIGLALAVIVANPFWMEASITSMDYMHPIPIFLAGVLLLQRRLPVLATMLFALAGAMRISYAPLGVFALAYALYVETDRLRRLTLVQSLVLLPFVLGYMYVPALISSHLTLAFLTSARPEWQGLFIWTVRWAYKIVYLYGLIGSIVIGVVLASVLWTAFAAPRADTIAAASGPRGVVRRHFLVLCLAAVVAHLALFYYIPVRFEYLLPVLVAVAGLMLYYNVHKYLLIVLTLAELSYAVVSIDVLRIDHLNGDVCAPVVPTAARFSPHVAPGVLYEELTGTSNELACYPQLLLERPANIMDRLPRPAIR